MNPTQEPLPRKKRASNLKVKRAETGKKTRLCLCVSVSVCLCVPPLRHCGAPSLHRPPALSPRWGASQWQLCSLCLCCYLLQADAPERRWSRVRLEPVQSTWVCESRGHSWLQMGEANDESCCFQTEPTCPNRRHGLTQCFLSCTRGAIISILLIFSSHPV